jgi:hypothetical protein
MKNTTKVRLKDFTTPLDQMTEDQLRRGINLWVAGGGIDGGDLASEAEYQRLLKKKESENE